MHGGEKCKGAPGPTVPTPLLASPIATTVESATIVLYERDARMCLQPDLCHAAATCCSLRVKPREGLHAVGSRSRADDQRPISARKAPVTILARHDQL